MALTSGTKLGPYEIQSPLGAGGMGEVYRATDAKLGRDVALKVLPAEMAHDPERLARFRREAKALSLIHIYVTTLPKAKTMALDPKTHRLFLSTAEAGQFEVLVVGHK